MGAAVVLGAGGAVATRAAGLWGPGSEDPLAGAKASDPPDPARPWRVARVLAGTEAPEKRGVAAIGFTRDGRQLFAAHEGFGVVWDVVRGVALNTVSLMGQMQRTDVAMSPNRRWLAVNSMSPGADEMQDAGYSLEVLDLTATGGTSPRQFRFAHGGGVAFSPDGSLVASGNDLCLPDPLTYVRTMAGVAKTKVKAVAFSPDGTLWAGACLDGTVHLCDVGTGQEVRTMEASHDELSHVAFSPDGRLVAAVGHDTIVHVWSAKTGDEVWTLNGHTGQVGFVSFSSRSRLLATTDDQNTTLFWDVASGAMTQEESRPGLRQTAFSPDGRWLVSGSAAGVCLWTQGGSETSPPA